MLFMKKFPLLILLLIFFIALPSYANQANEKNNFVKIRKRFEKDSNLPFIKFTMKINIGTWARPPIITLVSE